MAITNGYATLAELKARLAIPTGTTSHDSALEAAIEAASRRIEDDTNVLFYDTAATRYYTSDDHLTLFLPETLTAVSAIATLSNEASGTRTYGFTWSATDFDLEPYHGPPYTRITRTRTGLYWFPVERRGVRVTGTFGYCTAGSHPRQIREACLVMAARTFERAKSPLGVVGGEGITEAIRVSRSDPDYEALITPFKRQEMLVVPHW